MPRESTSSVTLRARGTKHGRAQSCASTLTVILGVGSKGSTDVAIGGTAGVHSIVDDYGEKADHDLVITAVICGTSWARASGGSRCFSRPHGHIQWPYSRTRRWGARWRVLRLQRPWGSAVVCARARVRQRCEKSGGRGTTAHVRFFAVPGGELRLRKIPTFG